MTQNTFEKQIILSLYIIKFNEDNQYQKRTWTYQRNAENSSMTLFTNQTTLPCLEKTPLRVCS